MNPLNFNQIKFDKANSIKLRNQKLSKASNFLRVFEILLVVAIISRISLQLPLVLTFKLSHDYLYRLSLILVSPPFMFVLGNVIVITLFINSNKFRNNTDPCNMKTPQTFKQEQHKKSIKSQQKKQRKTEESPVLTSVIATQDQQVVKIYYRSKSEKVQREKNDEESCRLQRSNTEVKNLKSCDSTTKCNRDAGEGNYYPEDGMSNEEFRRTIEDFIAKQQKFLRQEEGSSAFDSDF